MRKMFPSNSVLIALIVACFLFLLISCQSNEDHYQLNTNSDFLAVYMDDSLEIDPCLELYNSLADKRMICQNKDCGVLFSDCIMPTLSSSSQVSVDPCFVRYEALESKADICLDEQCGYLFAICRDESSSATAIDECLIKYDLLQNKTAICDDPNCSYLFAICLEESSSTIMFDQCLIKYDLLAPQNKHVICADEDCKGIFTICQETVDPLPDVDPCLQKYDTFLGEGRPNLICDDDGCREMFKICFPEPDPLDPCLEKFDDLADKMDICDDPECESLFTICVPIRTSSSSQIIVIVQSSSSEVIAAISSSSEDVPTISSSTPFSSELPISSSSISELMQCFIKYEGLVNKLEICTDEECGKFWQEFGTCVSDQYRPQDISDQVGSIRIYRIPSETRIEIEDYIDTTVIRVPFAENTLEYDFVSVVGLTYTHGDGLGVDIARFAESGGGDPSDNSTTQMFLGFTRSGEQLSFLVYVEEQGYYDLSVRYTHAKPELQNQNRAVILSNYAARRDGSYTNPSASVRVEPLIPTGADQWYNSWRTSVTGELFFEYKEFYIVTLAFPEGDLNVNYIDIFKTRDP